METELYLLNQWRKFVANKLAELPSLFTFHIFEHTKEVVKAARIIGRACQLPAEQLDTVLIAAGFTMSATVTG
jgi:hypothetical protein